MTTLPTAAEIALDLAAGNFKPATPDQMEMFAGASRGSLICEHDEFVMVYDAAADIGLCLQAVTCDMDVFYFDVNVQGWVAL